MIQLWWPVWHGRVRSGRFQARFRPAQQRKEPRHTQRRFARQKRQKEENKEIAAKEQKPAKQENGRTKETQWMLEGTTLSQLSRVGLGCKSLALTYASNLFSLEIHHRSSRVRSLPMQGSLRLPTQSARQRHQSCHCPSSRFADCKSLSKLAHALMAFVIKEKKIPKPCCAPTKLDEMTMIYHDDGNRVIMRKHRDMIVSSCGCHWSTESSKSTSEATSPNRTNTDVVDGLLQMGKHTSTMLNNVLIRAKSRFYCPTTQILLFSRFVTLVVLKA